MKLPDDTIRYLCSDSDEGDVGLAVNFLNVAVQNYVSQPQIEEPIMNAIDIYMSDR